MRDVKLQVETNWHQQRVVPCWTVKVFMVVAPHTRYRVAEFETMEADPMYAVAEKLGRVFE